jgi:hypothetical protein
MFGRTLILFLVFQSCLVWSFWSPADVLKHLQTPALRASGGGANCAACTIVVSLVEQLSVIHNKTVTATLAELCCKNRAYRGIVGRPTERDYVVR